MVRCTAILLQRCKDIYGAVPSNRPTFSEQPSQPRTDIYSELAYFILRDSERELTVIPLSNPAGTGTFSQPFPWPLLPPTPSTHIVPVSLWEMR